MTDESKVQVSRDHNHNRGSDEKLQSDKCPHLHESSSMARVLSIQSHVVSGYVGNKAAVFPLQLLGFDVDVINSVHFSNHTGYPGGIEGDVLNGSQLKSLLLGLQRNSLLSNIGHVLTGYIGSESFLRAVIDVVKTLRGSGGGESVVTAPSAASQSPECSPGGGHASSLPWVRYVCDPVLGDSGKFYVPPSLVAIYRDEVIPLADMITPNQFEVEKLTGIKVRTIDDAQLACAALHDLGPRTVVITSVELRPERCDGDTQTLPACKNVISILASTQPRRAPLSTSRGKKASDLNGNSDAMNRRNEMWRIDSPLLEGVFTGTGDLCAALLLAWTAREPYNLPKCLEMVTGTMFSVMKRTAILEGSSVASRELRLIQSKIDIENPPCLFRARKIE